MTLDLDLSENKITCLVGKNGTGKTTLFRSIKNLISAETFKTTASPYIFNENSRIVYNYNGSNYEYNFDKSIKQLDSCDTLDEEIKNSIFVELPIPHGVRFNQIRSLSDIDEELRRKIALNEYSQAVELISFLNTIYESNRFENLQYVEIKGQKYYFILRRDGLYIREDYLSSGEYFVIHLFKLIHKNIKLIVVDELDISLDASAQVRLVKLIREYCKENQVNILFTTHSLALIKTLNDDERYYLDKNDEGINIRNISYNYIKSLMYGFNGWDKYILVEDNVLREFIYFLLNNCEIISKYKIIEIGGGTQVVEFMSQNIEESFLADRKNIISILDGDQNGKRYTRRYEDLIFFLPQKSVEKEFYKLYIENRLNKKLNQSMPSDINESRKNKWVYNTYIKEGIYSRNDIFKEVCSDFEDEISNLVFKVVSFLNS